VAKPMPLFPPVMSAFLPVSFMIPPCLLLDCEHLGH
jgi:hypothetical protein